MPIDEYIEDVTDGTPAIAGDCFAIQRLVGGVWTDYFIKAENIAGGGVLAADVTITEVTLGFNEVLPLVADKCSVVLDPPVLQVSGNSPTGLTEDLNFGDGVTGQWSIQWTDSETDAAYSISLQGVDTVAGSGPLGINTSAFVGATVRLRFNFILADI